jgi:cellulose synthase/poly-beta-1,6-N-acetylglucosamine synthase-like glycosyltransferase
MSTLFFIIGLFVLAVTAPLIMELALISIGSLMPRRGTRREANNRPPRLAVIVPAHNEEISIGQCVQSLRESAPAEMKIFVVAHNCTDSTASLAQSAGAEVLIYDEPAANGKAHALRFGFTHAIEQDAEAVLVIDADSTVSSNLIPLVLSAFVNRAEAIQCRYEMQCVQGKLRSELVALAVRGFNFVRPLGRQSLGLSSGILGNGFALTAEVLKAVPYDALSVAEDLEYHLHLILAGKRVLFLENAVVSSDLPASETGEASQHSRWQGGRLRVARIWLPCLFREILRGRLVLLEPLLDLIGLPIAFAMVALLLAACLPLPWIHFYVALSFSIISIHVLKAAWAGPRRFRALGLLLLTPFYLLWKLRLIPNIVRASSARAAWVRTDRKVTVRTAQ